MILLNHSIQDLQGFNVTTKELLNILSSIRLGQVIRGKILDVLSTGEILALINGYKIKAHSNLKLEAGDILFLKVVSIKPSIVLQLYGIEYAKNADPVNKIINMFDLEHNFLNREIVSLLLKNNLTIDKNDILKLTNILEEIISISRASELDKEADPVLKQLINLAKNNNISFSEKDVIEAMIFLKTKDLPITLKTTLITINYLKNEYDLSNDLKDFFDIITKYSNKKEIQYIKSMINFKVDENALENLINKIGYDYEKRVYLLGTNPEYKKQILTTLKNILIEVVNNRFIDNFEVPEKLRIIAQRILNNIEFHQLLNSDDTKEIKNWFFQIPIKIDNEYKTVELKISGNNKKLNKMSKVPYTFSFSVNLSGIGKVSTYGSLYQKYLSLNFYSENQKNSDYLKANIEELEKRIENYGLLLNKINFEVSKTENKIDKVKSIDEKSSTVNIRA